MVLWNGKVSPEETKEEYMTSTKQTGSTDMQKNISTLEQKLKNAMIALVEVSSI